MYGLIHGRLCRFVGASLSLLFSSANFISNDKEILYVMFLLKSK